MSDTPTTSTGSPIYTPTTSTHSTPTSSTFPTTSTIAAPPTETVHSCSPSPQASQKPAKTTPLPASPTSHPTHKKWMSLALSESRKSPPKDTNYCVGACLVDASCDKLLASGYTLELPGNTHAEQVCLRKIAKVWGVEEGDLAGAFARIANSSANHERQSSDETVDGEERREGIVLYTTLEPCTTRSPGNTPCVQRILATHTPSLPNSGIRTVYTALKEPDWLVKENRGESVLEERGVRVVRVEGFDGETWGVATAGHVRKGESVGERDGRVREWEEEFGRRVDAV